MRTAATAMTTILFLVTANAFAVEFECKSSQTRIIIESEKGKWTGNYGQGGVMNDGADVIVEQKYRTPRGLAFSLNVDGQRGKFEVVSTAVKHGIYKGTLFTQQRAAQDVICTEKAE